MVSGDCKAVAEEPTVEPERAVEPFGSIKTAVMAALQEKW